ncbi:hypothetical protein SAMN04488092_107148 [Thalassovita taeanensis]|uniref:Uncharacterized protein n=2 Tax=Thalassovita taeanensis TaxID=657014 RepID=A0A1H9GEL5_9RHOB|nr:hypothetical protein SAMN04488092_107148 [Thalassovita taeanensis]
MNCAARKGLARRLSNRPDASLCGAALNGAIAKYGQHEIMKTNQDSQFSVPGWTVTLTEADVIISMDGPQP